MAVTGREIDGSCLARVAAKLRDGSRAARRIAQVVLDAPARTRDMPIEALGKAAGTNPSTITRFCQALGYRGYKDFQLDLAVAAAQGDSLDLEDLFRGEAPATIVRAVFESGRRSLVETEKLLDVAVAARVAALIRRADRTMFLGIGASGQTARRAAERFMSLGLPAFAATDPYEQVFTTAGARRGEVVVGISHTGLTVLVLDALRTARSRGARTVCITNYPDSPIAEASEFRLITSFREHRINAAVSSSHLAQLCVIDALYFLAAGASGRGARRLADAAEDRVQRLLRAKNRFSSA